MSQFQEKYKISDNNGGLWIWQNTVTWGTQMAILVTQSCPALCDPMDCSRQSLQSPEHARQEHWSGYPFSSSGHPPDPGIEHRSPALQADSLPSEPPRKPVLGTQDSKYLTCQVWGRSFQGNTGERRGNSWGLQRLRVTSMLSSASSSPGACSPCLQFLSGLAGLGRWTWGWSLQSPLPGTSRGATRCSGRPWGFTENPLVHGNPLNNPYRLASCRKRPCQSLVESELWTTWKPDQVLLFWTQTAGAGLTRDHEYLRQQGHQAAARFWEKDLQPGRKKQIQFGTCSWGIRGPEAAWLSPQKWPLELQERLSFQALTNTWNLCPEVAHWMPLPRWHLQLESRWVSARKTWVNFRILAEWRGNRFTFESRKGSG